MLAEALAGGRMHHAWLLAGPQGIGKATLAYRFARAALWPRRRSATASGQSLAVAETTSAAARQVKVLSHPGLLLMRRPYDIKAKRFATDHPGRRGAPAAARSSAHRAAGDGWRVVIVDAADELNINAANALLKSLEEPPTRTVFLLVSSAPGGLLPTIRSRCRALDLPAARATRPACRRRAGAGRRRDAARRTEAEWAPLERLADGSARRAAQPARPRRHRAQRARSSKLLSLLPKVDWRAVHALSDELQPIAAQPRFELFFELLLERACRASSAPPRPGEGSAPRTGAGQPGSSGRPGLPRLPPCGKE